jgi:uncharacterized SAM-binding protein YcdF (DUF218 family)
LLKNGYGQVMLVDAAEDTVIFGHTYADWARQFIRETAGQAAVRICPIREDSTVAETRYVEACLSGAHLNSILLVTSDYHTRRAESIFMSRLPRYTWYIAPAVDPSQFGTHWWQHRQWAKTALKELQKLLWWEVAERWR